MGQKNCYTPFDVDVSPILKVPEEFRVNTLLVWSDRLTGQGICQASVGLILKLERMSRLGLDPRQRLLLLRLLEDPLHVILDGLPKLKAGSARLGERRGFDLSMEQRLACAFFRNLKQARLGLSLDPSQPDADLTETLVWVLQQQFRLLGRQIEAAIAARRRPLSATWLELHGCFAYFQEQIQSIHHGGEAARHAEDCQAEAIYKRMLLLGLLAASNAELALDPELGPRLQTWVAGAHLTPAGPMAGESNLWLVDGEVDEPARWTHEPIPPGMKAQVLALPEDAASALQAPSLSFAGSGFAGAGAAR